MEFYELTHPYYETDYIESRANPIHMEDAIWLPGLACSRCGETWAGSRRLYLPINNPELQHRLTGAPLPEVEWLKLAHEVRLDLNLPDEFQLMPGDILGAPAARLMSTKIPDFLHPFPGRVIVQTAVLNTLQRAKLIGWNAIPVNVSWAEHVKHALTELPVLYELLVTGRVWREGVDKASITACEHCGRLIFPSWRPITEDRWDGSDFFNIDDNPNMVFVTSRVCEVLEEEHFTNYLCKPLP